MSGFDFRKHLLAKLLPADQASPRKGAVWTQSLLEMRTAGQRALWAAVEHGCDDPGSSRIHGAMVQEEGALIVKDLW